MHRKLLKLLETKQPLKELEVDHLEQLELLWASYLEKVYLFDKFDIVLIHLNLLFYGNCLLLVYRSSTY